LLSAFTAFAKPFAAPVRRSSSHGKRFRRIFGVTHAMRCGPLAGHSVTHANTVVPHVLANLELPDVLRVSASQILGQVQPPVGSQVQSRLEEGAALVQSEVDRIIAALPETISWSVVRHGIERVYGRARQARKRARRDVHQFHIWRRRSKELSYQLDVLAGAFGQRMAAIAHDLDPVLDGQTLGVDLIMLCQVLRTHAASVAGIVADPLLDELERRIATQARIARREGKRLFRTKPSEYARAVRHAGRIEPSRDAIASGA
jgi:hypothetical protein